MSRVVSDAWAQVQSDTLCVCARVNQLDSTIIESPCPDLLAKRELLVLTRR